MTTIIGISAFYHDAAACLIKDGNIIAAAQEERFTRIKHDQSFPPNPFLIVLKPRSAKPRILIMLFFMTSLCLNLIV